MKKRIIAAFLAAIIFIGSINGSFLEKSYAAEEGKGYEVESAGYAAEKNKFTVTIKEDKIESISVVEYKDTPNVVEKITDEFYAQFKGKSTAAEVDAVVTISGATVTSNSAKNAAKKALELHAASKNNEDNSENDNTENDDTETPEEKPAGDKSEIYKDLRLEFLIADGYGLIKFSIFKGEGKEKAVISDKDLDKIIVKFSCNGKTAEAKLSECEFDKSKKTWSYTVPADEWKLNMMSEVELTFIDAKTIVKNETLGNEDNTTTNNSQDKVGKYEFADSLYVQAKGNIQTNFIITVTNGEISKIVSDIKNPSAQDYINKFSEKLLTLSSENEITPKTYDLPERTDRARAAERATGLYLIASAIEALERYEQEYTNVEPGFTKNTVKTYKITNSGYGNKQNEYNFTIKNGRIFQVEANNRLNHQAGLNAMNNVFFSMLVGLSTDKEIEDINVDQFYDDNKSTFSEHSTEPTNPIKVTAESAKKAAIEALTKFREDHPEFKVAPINATEDPNNNSNNEDNPAVNTDLVIESVSANDEGFISFKIRKGNDYLITLDENQKAMKIKITNGTNSIIKTLGDITLKLQTVPSFKDLWSYNDFNNELKLNQSISDVKVEFTNEAPIESIVWNTGEPTEGIYFQVGRVTVAKTDLLFFKAYKDGQPFEISQKDAEKITLNISTKDKKIDIKLNDKAIKKMTQEDFFNATVTIEDKVYQLTGIRAMLGLTPDTELPYKDLKIEYTIEGEDESELDRKVINIPDAALRAQLLKALQDPEFRSEHGVLLANELPAGHAELYGLKEEDILQVPVNRHADDSNPMPRYIKPAHETEIYDYEMELFLFLLSTPMRDTYSILRNKGIESLEGLEHAKNLTRLNIEGNKITDLSPIQGLTKMRSLYAGRNQFNDISALKNLVNLETLHLEDNKITNIDALSGMKDLISVGLNNNEIDSISVLQGKNKLAALSFMNNKVSDLNPLRDSKLNKLWMSNNQISDLSPIVSCTNIVALYVDGNIISDMSPVDEMYVETIDLIKAQNNNPVMDAQVNEILSPIKSKAKGYVIYTVTDEFKKDIEITKQNNIIIKETANGKQITIAFDAQFYGRNAKFAKEDYNFKGTLTINVKGKVDKVAERKEEADTDLVGFRDAKVKNLLLKALKDSAFRIENGVVLTNSSYVKLPYEQSISKEEMAMFKDLGSLLMGKGIYFLVGLEAAVNLEKLNVQNNNIDHKEHVDNIVAILKKFKLTDFQDANNPYNTPKVLTTEEIKAQTPNESSLKEKGSVVKFEDEKLKSELLKVLINKTHRFNSNVQFVKEFDDYVKDSKDTNIYTGEMKMFDTILKNPYTKIGVLDNKGITSLVGLEHATNLARIDIEDNKITDLSPLKDLEKLLAITATNNDISTIVVPKNIVRLYLENNKISDLSPLANLKQLDTLNVKGNKVSDLSPLKGLGKLEFLSIKDNKVSDLTPIANLKELDDLYLNNNNISDISVLKGLTHIENLTLNGNKISDMTPLNDQVFKYASSPENKPEVKATVGDTISPIKVRDMNKLVYTVDAANKEFVEIMAGNKLEIKAFPANNEIKVSFHSNDYGVYYETINDNVNEVIGFSGVLRISTANEETGTDKPGIDKPGIDKPGTDKPGTDKPETNKPGTDKPGTGTGTNKPETDKPETDKPGTGTGSINYPIYSWENNNYKDDYRDFIRTAQRENNKVNEQSSIKATPVVKPVVNTTTEQKTMTFKDVNTNDWFYSSVNYVVVNGLMNGLADGSFGPNVAVSKEMLITTLYRAAGSQQTDADINFADVKSGEWYTDAIKWGVANGIILGDGSNKFGTNKKLTREEMVLMIKRYYDLKGEDTAQRAELENFNDNNKISEWAKEAIEWAVAAKIIKGKSVATIDPKANLTRAELATVLMNITNK